MTKGHFVPKSRNLRRMTEADYAELGIDPPADYGFDDVGENTPWGTSLDDLIGRRFTMKVHRPIQLDLRCDECGDETGSCSCD